MSKHEPFNFMPPDEPTAAYPIGRAEENPPINVLPEPPPAVSLDAPSAKVKPAQPADHDDASDTSFNPMIALALLGIPVALAILVVLLALVLVSLSGS